MVKYVKIAPKPFDGTREHIRRCKISSSQLKTIQRVYAHELLPPLTMLNFSLRQKKSNQLITRRLELYTRFIRSTLLPTFSVNGDDEITVIVNKVTSNYFVTNVNYLDPLGSRPLPPTFCLKTAFEKGLITGGSWTDDFSIHEPVCSLCGVLLSGIICEPCVLAANPILPDETAETADLDLNARLDAVHVLHGTTMDVIHSVVRALKSKRRHLPSLLREFTHQYRLAQRVASLRSYFTDLRRSLIEYQLAHSSNKAVRNIVALIDANESNLAVNCFTTILNDPRKDEPLLIPRTEYPRYRVRGECPWYRYQLSKALLDITSFAQPEIETAFKAPHRGGALNCLACFRATAVTTYHHCEKQQQLNWWANLLMLYGCNRYPSAIPVSQLFRVATKMFNITPTGVADTRTTL